MASQQGVCTNFSNCLKADNKEKISIPMGSDFVCPECGKDLTPTQNGTGGIIRGFKKTLIASVVTALIALTAWGIYQLVPEPIPTGTVKGINNPTTQGEKIVVNVSGEHKKGMKEMLFEILDPQNKSLKKEVWNESGSKASHELSLKTDDWEIGTYQYSFRVKNISDKSFEIKGNFKLISKTGLSDLPPTPTVPGNGSSDPGSLGGAKVPMEAKLNFQQGMTYSERQNYNNAIKEFTLAIEKYPNYAVAYSNRAGAYIRQKKYNIALEDLNRAVQIEQNNPEIYYNLMALHSIEKRIDLALYALDKCLKYGFNNYDALRKDSDLANLRKNTEYWETLEKHKIFLK